MLNDRLHDPMRARPDSPPTHGTWPLVIPLLVGAFELAWAVLVEGSGRVSTLSMSSLVLGRVGGFLAWPLGIVACLLGICYAIENLRQRGNPQLAQLAMMLNALVILAIVLRIVIVF